MITAKEANIIATAVHSERRIQNLIDLGKEVETLETDILEAAKDGRFEVEIHFPGAKFEYLTWKEQVEYIGAYLNQRGYSVSARSRHILFISWD